MESVVNVLACLALAVVLGTDVFFTVVGRAALARASAKAVLEVMAHLHAVADRRMPVFGAAGIIGAAVLAIDANGRWLAVIALVTQLAMLAVYTTRSKPVNVRMIAALGTEVDAQEARGLQVQWEAGLGYRVGLLVIAMGALLLRLARLGA